MGKNLVIVESPAKAKTIENYLGKDFTVKSSIGHIRDLPKKGGMAIDIENGLLSITSPTARALIGKSLGDSVEVTTPGGSKSYEIIRVDYK